MADKRSSRVKKQIDYSKFSGMDSENDFAEDADDFENFTPPATKKLKSEKRGKKENKKIVKSSVTVHPEPASKKSNQRKSPDDRLFEKELELALELSKNDNSQADKDKQVNKSEDSKTNTAELNTCNIVLDREDIHVKGQTATIKPVTNTAIIKDSDTIEILEENIEEIPKKRSGAKKRAYVEDDELSTSSDADEDFHLDGQSEDSESEFNPSDDDLDFDQKKTSKKNGASKTTKKVTKKPPLKSSKNTSVLTPKADSNTGRSFSTPLASTGSTGQSVKKPRLTPAASIVRKNVTSPSTGLTKNCSKSPLTAKVINTKVRSPSSVVLSHSASLGGVNLKSPNSGALRLGLSRNARFKPLHANVKVTPR